MFSLTLSSMKKIPLAFFVIGLLALGAGQIVFVPGALAAHGAKAEKAEKSENKKDDISGGRFAGDPIYVRISPMVLPIISDNGVEQLVSLMITVQVNDIEAANALHKNMPRVMDSLLRHLYGGLDEGSLRRGRLINIPKIKSKSVDAIAEIIGKEQVHDVLVEAVAQRML